MNMKKIAILALSLCMIAAIAVTGTIAYFKDTEQVTNTMTIGDVKINIEELMKNSEPNGDKYVEWDEEGFTLYPMTNTQGVNAYNKLVSVFNESDEHAAYIRTIVLFEQNANVKSCDDDCCLNGVHFAYTDGDYKTTVGGKDFQGRGTTNNKLAETVTIGEKTYNVVVFTDKNERAIAVGESQDSLTSVWLDQNVSDEEAEGWGGDVEVIVLAQAIQSANLTHAEAMAQLGEVNQALVDELYKDAPKAKINDYYVKL